MRYLILLSAFVTIAATAQTGTFTVDTNTHCTNASTPLDCTIAAAQAYAASHHQPVEVRLGAGTFDTAAGLQMAQSARYTVNIHGAGKSDFGGGTTIRLTATLATAVINYPFLKLSDGPGWWSNINLQGFTIDANNKSPMCFDLNALRVSHLTDLSCTGANGPRAWFRIGGLSSKYGGLVPDGYRGGAFQVMASDIFLYNNGAQPKALVDPVITNGAITSYTLRDAGLFRQTSTVPLFLKGPDAATAPCKKMPQQVLGHLSPDPQKPGFSIITSITQASNGEGCTFPINITAADNPQAAYGFEITATDSSFYDLTDDSVGRIAGIEDRVSGKALFVHPHIWNTWGGMELWGGETVITPEFDSNYGYGVFFRYGSGSVVVDPTFVYLKHPSFNAVADFLFSPSATNMSISDQQCETPNPNPGYIQFVAEAGALDLGYGALSQDEALSHQKAATTGSPSQRAFPVGFQASGVAVCKPHPKPTPGITITSTPITSATQDRRLSFTAAAQPNAAPTAFLLAEIPPPQKNSLAASLRATLLTSIPGHDPVQRVTLLSGDLSSHPANAIPGTAEAASVRTYAQPDGTLNIYLWLSANTTATVLIDLLQTPDIHLEPSPAPATPTGTLVSEAH